MTRCLLTLGLALSLGSLPLLAQGNETSRPGKPASRTPATKPAQEASKDSRPLRPVAPSPGAVPPAGRQEGSVPDAVRRLYPKAPAPGALPTPPPRPFPLAADTQEALQWILWSREQTVRAMAHAKARGKPQEVARMLVLLEDLRRHSRLEVVRLLEKQRKAQAQPKKPVIQD